MRKLQSIIICLLVIFVALVPVSDAYAVTSEVTQYTYTYDWWANPMASPDAYTTEAILIGSDLGLGQLSDAQGLFVKDEMLFICDSGNNRIIELNRNLKLVRVIESIVVNGEESKLSYPSDVYVDDNNDMYICDQKNQRVLHVDYNLNFIKSYVKPENEETIDANFNFIPVKCVVDTAGRLYVMAKNVNKGFMLFDKHGEFSGYVGATDVNVTLAQVIEKKLMTKAQRERSELFVPTEYSNISIDQDDFLYVTMSTFDAGKLDNLSDSVTPIRRLNSLGDDILIRNSNNGFFAVGDLSWGTGGDVSGPSRFNDICALDNDTYYAIDYNRCRIFAYDFQGNLLYVFGGKGNKDGFFQYPTAIDNMGDDLIVLDSVAGTVTRFTLTEFGQLINAALAEYKAGRYDESAEYWEQVLKLNGNYDLAYIGIGRAYLRQERYKEAMDCFKLKLDSKNYSKAFLEYRKEWVESHIYQLIIGFLFLCFLPKIIRLIKKVVKRKGAKA